MRLHTEFASGLGEKVMVVTEADVARVVGTVGPLLMYEFLRTGASVRELRHAVSIAGSAHGSQRKLSQRTRRLVDLISAVGHSQEAGTAA